HSDVSLDNYVSVNCYQVGLLDSVLIIRDGSEIAININDAELSESDLRYLKNFAARPQLIFNQFSIAGYDGYADREWALRRAAKQKIATMLSAHRVLEAKATLPFASFVYFSCIDNSFINEFANSITTVQAAFERARLNTIVLHPGDEYTLGECWDNAPAV